VNNESDALPWLISFSLGLWRNLVRNSTHLSQTAVVFIISVALVALARSEDTDLSIHIDHVMLGASNLERALSDFEKATGVLPYSWRNTSLWHTKRVGIAGPQHLPRAHSSGARR
jgi:hypothetical protein